MSTSGGSSGGGGTFPLNGADGTYRYAETAVAGTLEASVDDGALGSLATVLALTANHAASSSTAALLAEGSAVNVGFTATALDPAPSSASMLVDGKGLTIDENGNPQWSGTLPQAELLVGTAHLNAAAILTLHSAPTTIVAAPGAGKIIAPVSGYLEFVPGAVSYQTPGVLGFFYGTGAATVPLTGNGLGLLLGTSAPPVNSGSMVPPMIAPVNASVGANKALTLGITTGDTNAIGPIATAAIAAGGTGYAVGDTGTLAVDNYGPAATYVVTTVAPVTGAVTGFTITGAGDGYDPGDSPFATATGGAQPGAGINFTVNATAVHAADGDLYVTVYYAIVTLH